MDARMHCRRALLQYLVAQAFEGEPQRQELQEPFYTDRHGGFRLRPQMVQLMSSGQLYAMAVSKLYGEPTLAHLSAWGVLQLTARKGLAKEKSEQLSETTLIQTTPLRLNDHLIVAKSVLRLCIREKANVQSVYEATKRIASLLETPEFSFKQENNSKDALLQWLRVCCHLYFNDSNNEEEIRVDEMFEDTNMSLIVSGPVLGHVLRLYCPETRLRSVKEFCEKHLASVHFSAAEALSSDELLAEALVADLFNALEVEKNACARPPGKSAIVTATKECRRSGLVHSRPQMPIPFLREFLDDRERTDLVTDLRAAKVAAGLASSLARGSSVIVDKEEHTNNEKEDLLVVANNDGVHPLETSAKSTTDNRHATKNNELGTATQYYYTLNYI